MTSYSASEIAQGLTYLKGFIGLQIVSNILNAFMPNLATFGGPIFQSLISTPLSNAGPYSGVGKYTEIFTWVLFKFVGTTYDPDNAFCKWMFFYFPIYYGFWEITSFLSYYLAGGFLDLSSVTGMISSLVTLALGTLYTFGPAGLTAYYFY